MEHGAGFPFGCVVLFISTRRMISNGPPQPLPLRPLGVWEADEDNVHANGVFQRFLEVIPEYPITGARMAVVSDPSLPFSSFAAPACYCPARSIVQT
jgi:hypothetical protein